MSPLDQWVEAGDFNGIMKGNLLPLYSHGKDKVIDVSGRELTLSAGLTLTVADHDLDENGNTDRVFVTGTVVPRPAAFAHGRDWYLHIDLNGIRHESDLRST
jgi:hypothetical protein